jgi:hypothetical protein
MNPTQKPATTNPSPEGKPPKADDAIPTLIEMTRLLEELSRSITPVIEFHKAVEDATQDDLRLYWDVRVVRGADTPFAHLTGSTPLPRILASKMRPLAPSILETEITNKILRPLCAMVQTEVERVTFEELAAEGRNPGCWPEDAGCPAM